MTQFAIVSGPHFSHKSSRAESARTDLVIVAQGAGEKIQPSASSFALAYAPALSQLEKSQAFNGKHGTLQFIRFGGKNGAAHVLFVGLGHADALTPEKVRQAAGSAWARLCSEKCPSAAIEAEPLLFPHLQAFAEGLLLANYRFDKHKKPPKTAPIRPSKVFIALEHSRQRPEVARALAAAEDVAAAMTITRDWSNEPSNVGNALYYADQARRLARQHGLKCRILGLQEIQRERMGLVLGVNRGASIAPRVVIVDYTPKRRGRGRAAPKTVVLVGKGVTFDSGGISIKPSARMEEMKHDMGGAATVMGAVALAARSQCPNRVIGLMLFVENMPDANAIQPGNILKSRSGKSVEIINTDAEGRLILADGLDLAQDPKAFFGIRADAIVDVATLTGAISVALGKYCCGLMGNDDALIAGLQKSAAACGERVWPMPLYDEYFEDLKSEHADLRNTGTEGGGGASRAASFLKHFIHEGTRWAHLDIANTSANASHLSYCPKKGASGLHVRTLADFARNLEV